MTFAVGSLVQARGREWVVLPESSTDLLVLRPLGGSDLERAGVYLPLEGDDVRPATFALPDASRPGDFRSSRLLRDAVRLGFRSSAGPFRSFARIHVEPRPYQLVPLLMALKLDPVRLLIADDVGIGKTIEAALIARELLDRGEIRRLAVLCPPHLAEQWQAELREKFHIEAELVLPSTVSRLERSTATGQSLFDLYPFVIISTEYVKSSRRRDEFVRTCPELVIVDEAHTCAFALENRGGRHLRHQLLQKLSEDKRRHLILVTATPHSGDEGAFRSLLGLLRTEFRTLPEDLTGSENASLRRTVANHLVQRRRADVRHYMAADTPFPEREEAEEIYRLTEEYRKLLNAILDYAQERVLDKSLDQRRQRISWWSALALLRSLASSPAAVAATLRTRSVTLETESAEDANRIGERLVLDLDDSDAAELIDITPGSQEEEETADDVLSTQQRQEAQRERLLRFARQADRLCGPALDAKLARAIELVKRLLAAGFRPILFCRFIPTADYVAEELRKALPGTVEIMAVTGKLPPTEREARIAQLARHEQRVLVATDCLSEGINLQAHFSAVMHYDLSWNPTRHEQREGRVDRYGQPNPIVRALTYYGLDNQIDGVVLEVLLRKHQAIRNSLGVSVPVPGNTNDLVQALMEGLLLRGRSTKNAGGQLSFADVAPDFAADLYRDLHTRWDNVTDRERRSRTLFAQASINVDDVYKEWLAVRAAIGAGADVQRFVRESIEAHEGGSVVVKPHYVEIHVPKRAALREIFHHQEMIRARFELPVVEGIHYLSRTHPLVEGLATYVMDTALDPQADGVARRSGAMRTHAVSQTTTLLLLRFRYHILTRQGDTETPLLAEACATLAFRGRPGAHLWLRDEETETLLQSQPDQNLTPQQASQFINRIVEGLAGMKEELNDIAEERGEQLLEAHRRVRAAARVTGVRYSVQTQLPPDVLGVYVLLPVVT